MIGIGIEIELSVRNINAKDFPSSPDGNNPDELQGGLKASHTLTELADFNWLRGFCSRTHTQVDNISVENIVLYAKLIIQGILNITPGKFGLIVVKNRDALEGYQNLFYVLPLGFQIFDGDGILTGVHVTQDQETGDFSINSKVIVVRNHVITGVI